MPFCYLLVFPYVDAPPPLPVEPIKGLKDAPYFQPVDIQVRSLGQAPRVVEGTSITIHTQIFDERVQIMECHFDLAAPLSMATIQHRNRIETALRDQLVPASAQASGLYEEYITLMLAHVDGTPDEFIDRHAQDLARFIRSQREIFGPSEIEDILISRIRYSEEELTLVDWEGALLISPTGDFQADIELLKIGNYQLVRYRLLAQAIEDSLLDIKASFFKGPRTSIRPGPTRAALRRIIQHRLEMILEFEHTEQNLLLIGDWYSAKLYHAIQDEFYLDDWKQTVQSKLDNLENIVTTIQENFAFSWKGFLDNVELTGWLILLLGYFILFFIEWRATP